MMKWIKKIFDNSNEYNSSIVGTQAHLGRKCVNVVFASL